MTTESTFRAPAIANIALCMPIGLYRWVRHPYYLVVSLWVLSFIGARLDC